ncbi:MAG: LEA type 2 family protein [Gammaproteobacteria bacterium]|nr:LEA type 2 family protein [Gammaproteobacteria bacterium]
MQVTAATAAGKPQWIGKAANVGFGYRQSQRGSRRDRIGRPFASGVSDTRGSVPRFGERVIEVPVSVSMLRMVGQAIGLLDGKPVDRITYQMRGKLSGTGVRTARFRSQGEFDLRGGGAAAAPPPPAGQ